MPSPSSPADVAARIFEALQRRERLVGTFSGEPFQGVHATGRRLDLRGVDAMHIVDGLLVDNVICYDGMSFASQIGMVPSAGSMGYRALTAAFNAQTAVRNKLPLPTRRG
jgi:hypothetical protein